MADVQWIKLQVDIFDNDKIKIIRKMPEGYAMVVVWIELMCLAGKANSDGMLVMSDEIPYTEEMLAAMFDMDQRLISLALKTFQHLRMIEVIDDIILLKNWSKYQSNDKLATIRDQGRVRQQRFRDNRRDSNADRNALRNANSVTKALPEPLQKRYPSQENKSKNESKNVDPEEKENPVVVVREPAREDDRHDRLSLTLTEKIPSMLPADFNAVIGFQEDGMTDAAIEFAVSIAARKENPSFRLVRFLLNEWLLNDIKTLDAAKEYERRKLENGKRAATARAAPEYIPPSQQYFFPD